MLCALDISSAVTRTVDRKEDNFRINQQLSIIFYREKKYFTASKRMTFLASVNRTVSLSNFIYSENLRFCSIISKIDVLTLSI